MPELPTEVTLSIESLLRDIRDELRELVTVLKNLKKQGYKIAKIEQSNLDYLIEKEEEK